MSATTTSRARRRLGRLVRQTLALVAGVGIGLVLATMVRDYALLWMVLLPLALWTLANRAGVRSAAGGFDLRRVPAGDVVAMTLGVLLAVPAALTALDGSVPRTAALVAMLTTLGFGMLGYAGAIRDGATLAVDGRGRAARLADVALRGVRSTSGLTNVYLAAVGTLLAFPGRRRVAAYRGDGAHRRAARGARGTRRRHRRHDGRPGTGRRVRGTRPVRRSRRRPARTRRRAAARRRATCAPHVRWWQRRV